MTDSLAQADANHARVKAHYLGLPGKTEAGWVEVKRDPRKFNRVWRHLLGLPPSDWPPGVTPREKKPSFFDGAP